MRSIGSVALRATIAVSAACVALALAELTVRLFIPVRSVGPLLTRYDPVYGSSLKENLFTVRSSIEFSTTFTTNSLGFRGPEPSSFPVGGILFLGDSYTMGYGVNDGEEYPALIAKELRTRGIDMPVVNAAVGRTGNGRWLKFLRREGDRVAPKIVVFQMFGNDFDDNIREKLWRVEADGATLTELAPPPPELERQLQRYLEPIPFLMNSYLVGLLRQLWVSPATALKAQQDEAVWPSSTSAPTDILTYRIIEESLAYCNAHGIKAILLTLGVDGERGAILRERIASLNVPLIRLPAKSEAPELFYTIDGHWNSRGHKVVAGEIRKMSIIN